MFNQLKSHVLYTEYEHLKQICMPLRELRIIGFIFMRFFNDGTFIDLSNQLEWSTFFLNNYFQTKYPKEMISNHMSKTINLWTLDPNNIIWQEGERYFNFGNGISLTVKKKEYMDLYCFYSLKKDHDINQFYLSNLHLLEQFCCYFLEKAKPIINKGIQNKLHIPALYFLDDSHSNHKDYYLYSGIDKFFKQIGLKYSNYYSIKKNIILSPREERIVQYYSQGMTAQQIADKIYVSRRTVEAHLINLKSKLNCKNLPQLIYVCSKYIGIFDSIF